MATQLVPYYDRAQIEHGALASQHLALLFLADPIDAFFLEIQGSGRVRLADGRIVRVTYDGQNGRPYVPIGRLLIERGELTRDERQSADDPRLAGGPPGPGAGVDGRQPVLCVLHAAARHAAR